MEAEGKLVRDRIPELVEAAGVLATTRRLRRGERLPALLLKLQEESDELRSTTSLVEQSEELADVLEVLKAVANEIGVAWGEVESIAASKRAERGGFDGGIWMTLT